MALKFANNAQATIAASITSSTTTIIVASGLGNRFPSLQVGDYFVATLYNTMGQSEIIRVNQRSGDVLTVVRGQEGTTPLPFDSGSRIANQPTAGQMATFFNADNDGLGSGLDADRLQGFNQAATNTPSTLVRRNATGDISVSNVSATSITNSGPSALQAVSATTLSASGSSTLQDVSATTVTATTVTATTVTATTVTASGAISGASVTAGGGTLAQATETIRGTVELATAAEAAEYLSDLVALTPAKIRSALNAPGLPPIYACRAWVNFNGIGTVAIRGSGNVSSITDRGTGVYTANFTTAMPDANYAALVTTRRSGTVSSGFMNIPATGETNAQYDVNGILLYSMGGDGSNLDADTINLAIFR